jgi:predicted RNase H-like HicB family nuclease
MWMLTDYIRAAMREAKYEILADDGSYYGEIPGFQGLYANEASLEVCRDQLEEVLEEWVLVRVSRNLPLPVVGGIELAVREIR